jgi:predicted acyl esterase
MRKPLIAVLLCVHLSIWSSGAMAAQRPVDASAADVSLPLAEVAPGATEVQVPMRDGVQLAANLYLPAGKGPFPCLLTRTPYHKDEARTADPANAKAYTDNGYAYLVQDIRGQGRSQGTYYVSFTFDGFDGYDTVEWMAQQGWCNGSIGVTGNSAMGIAGMLTAFMAPPHLKAGYIGVTPSSFLASSWIGGAFKDKDEGDWMRARGVSAEEIARAATTYIDDAAWSGTSIEGNRKYIQIPIFHHGGWYDVFSEGAVQNFAYLQNHGAAGARGNQKLEMGPYGHGPLSGDLAYPNSLADRKPNEIRWFDYWLKGADNGIMDEPPVRLYMMASARKGALSAKNRWMEFGNWPPSFRQRSYYLQADGRLSKDLPQSGVKALTYTADPRKPVPTVGGANLTFERGPMDQRPIGQRQDYLRFRTSPLDEDIAIAGPVSVDLWASTDGADTDFVVKLVDVYPDGYEAIIVESAIRARFRGGRRPDDVRMMTPGVPEKLVLDLRYMALTFEKGHRIAVHVASSSSPKFDLNPNTGAVPGPGVKMRTARNAIHIDAEHPSAVKLPLIYPADLGNRK